MSSIPPSPPPGSHPPSSDALPEDVKSFLESYKTDHASHKGGGMNALFANFTPADTKKYKQIMEQNISNEFKREERIHKENEQRRKEMEQEG